MKSVCRPWPNHLESLLPLKCSDGIKSYSLTLPPTWEWWVWARSSVVCITMLKWRLLKHIFPQRGLTKDKLDLNSHDSVGQQRQSLTWGYCSSQAAVSAEVFWTAPASVAGLFPYKERSHSGWACNRFLITVEAIYTPCCFEPVTVEVKCHQRFRKLSHVTLEGSYQRQAIKMTILF